MGRRFTLVGRGRATYCGLRLHSTGSAPGCSGTWYQHKPSALRVRFVRDLVVGDRRRFRRPVEIAVQIAGPCCGSTPLQERVFAIDIDVCRRSASN